MDRSGSLPLRARGRDAPRIQAAEADDQVDATALGLRRPDKLTENLQLRSGKGAATWRSGFSSLLLWAVSAMSKLASTDG